MIFKSKAISFSIKNAFLFHVQKTVFSRSIILISSNWQVRHMKLIIVNLKQAILCPDIIQAFLTKILAKKQATSYVRSHRLNNLIIYVYFRPLGKMRSFKQQCHGLYLSSTGGMYQPGHTMSYHGSSR